MKSLKSLYFSAVSALPLNWLLKHSSLDLLIPYHHLVSDIPVPFIEPLYAFKDLRRFEADLDYMLTYFQPVSLREVIEQRKKGLPFRKKSFLLTFDDGLRQVYDVVMPLLLRKGVPAALFVCPQFVDNKELFYDLKKGLVLHKLREVQPTSSLLARISQELHQPITSVSQLEILVRSVHYHTQPLADKIGQLLEIDFSGFARKYRPFMSSEQIHHFISKGFEVGAHSMDHPLYSAISLEQQLQQTLDSIHWVSTTFGLSYKAFAFPHVDTGVNNSFFRRLFENEALAPDLVLGNRTGMIDHHARVVHRYIGENPHLAAKTMVKAVLSYNIVKRSVGSEFINRAR